VNLYTKNGRPLQVSGDRVYSRSGTYVGHLSRGKLYAPSGRYAGTVDGDRVVYRSSDSATVSSPTAAGNIGGTGAGSVGGSGVWGDEPPLPD